MADDIEVEMTEVEGWADIVNEISFEYFVNVDDLQVLHQKSDIIAEVANKNYHIIDESSDKDKSSKINKITVPTPSETLRIIQKIIRIFFLSHEKKYAMFTSNLR